MTDYYVGLGLKVKYLHSDITTIDRYEILKDLRLGVFDVLIGINLLREGLDLPEVSLVAVTDADKEGFLRSERSLIQTIGRAARNSEGKVILYGDNVTDSMRKAIDETQRRRQLQEKHNTEHGITPRTVAKKKAQGLTEIFGYENLEDVVAKESGRPKMSITSPKDAGQIDKEIKKLRKQMKDYAKELNFEDAAAIRDEIKRLELFQLQGLSGEVDAQMDQVLEGGGTEGKTK